MPQPNFLDRFSYRILAFSQHHRLIESEDKVLVSVSGGLDSVCLLSVLISFQKRIDFSLHIVHFNHGLRDESREEESFVQHLAERHAIPVTVIRSQSFAGQKGMQNRARRWRHNHLNQLLSDLSFNKIATGHHLDDLVETQIWRLLRGSSLFSLNPIQVKKLPYIRPLLNTPKAELKAYLESIQQDWRDDCSNRSNTYTRNLIRNRIIPEMEQVAGGNLAEKLNGINCDALHLKQLFNTLVARETYQCSEIPYQTLTNLNPLLSHEIIHRFLLHHNQQEVTRSTIEKIHALTVSGKGNWKINLKDGVNVIGRQKRIGIENKPL